MKRVISSLLIATALVGSAIQPAAARDHHRHHDNTGRIIAGGVAAGVVGGLIGGALVNGGPRYVDDGPRYVESPRYVEPEPRCWYEDRDVRNRYDGGYHAETVRVCE
ncbi:membrane protein (plasmid) [Rhizobium leguminosarum bv. trifolii CB782]|uniref:Transmembrane protein n=1 Tax=Rhizobium hidalgonense TaxID=1538159 RepID=A0A2A6KEQ2_9HYPH|nr:hypothetical protein [Rhizobium hidalgonense]AHG49540.1 membrane protein [Rhizobium leguminosarum bv. trifolii CB782]EJC78060.1 hypothetical protein Rleg10DRAFT_6789 [Rhizobium leguminosarum bv. trifolii WSM2012]MDR9772862.1 hypothetical protein [Rhizobium hidalgonense]MDR9807727.1 hypothetical protein [Rhizobium hidalgonense]MDR9812984.1 hypothetical protein [Rhizobium hidalgonense]